MISPSSNTIIEYYNELKSGRTNANRKILKTYKKLEYDINDKTSEYFYSEKRASHAIDFIQNYCKHSQGKLGGQLIELELWEIAMIKTIFGFIDINGIRKYNKAVLIVAKKNGKSLLASAIGLYMQIADGEAGPEVYAVATKRDQAKKIWLVAKQMVMKSGILRKRIKPLVADLVSEFNDGSFKPLASDVDTLDGLNVSCALMDEFHQWKNGKALYDIIADGTGAREQPLIFMTSTAGKIREDIYDEIYDDATNTINGYFQTDGYKDERTIYFIYELDNREEWKDESCWIKANPGLGTIKNKKTLSEKVAKALRNPNMVKNLVCKEFNVRETSSESWLTFEDLNNESTYNLKDLKPRYCIGGLDLSNTTDLTCATIIFKVENDETLYVRQMYWLPYDLLDKRVNDDKIRYDLWLERKLLRVSEGNKINYKDVVAWFLEVQSELDIYIYKIGYDSWNSQYVVDELKQNFGLESTEEVVQGARTMSSPMKVFASDLASKKINYDNNPILKWCLSNAAIQTDRNDNITLCKTSNPKRRIDGVASLLDAYICLDRNSENYNNMI